MPSHTPTPQAIPLGQKSLVVPDNPMRYELARLKSFQNHNWNKVFAEQLALAGFYAIKDSEGKLEAYPYLPYKI